jgi:hypothetical protein
MSFLQAGVRRGMKLTGISDPVREYEVWDLQVTPFSTFSVWQQ